MAKAPIPHFPISNDPRIEVHRTQRFSIDRLSPRGFSGGGYSAPGVNLSDPGASTRARSSGGISAPRVHARLPRAPMGGINISPTPLLVGLSMLQKGINSYAAYRNDKADTARKAYILEQEPVIKAYFDKIEDTYKTFKGAKAAGIPVDIAERKEEIFSGIMPEEADDVTMNMFRNIVNQEYSKLSNWARSYELAQFDLADTAALKNISDRVSIAAMKLPPGADIEAMHAIVENGLEKFEFLHTDVSEEHKTQVRASLVQEATAKMMQAWIADAPAVAVSYFDKNKSMLKTKLPDKFNQIEKMVDGVRGDALYDQTLGNLKTMFPGDRPAQAKKLNDPEFVEKYMSVNGIPDWSMAQQLQKNIMASDAAETAMNLRTTKMAESEVTKSIINNNYTKDEKGNIRVNYAAAIPELRRAKRLGKIRPDVADAAIEKWIKNSFTVEDNNRVTDKIYAGDYDTEGELLHDLSDFVNPNPWLEKWRKWRAAEDKKRGGANYRTDAINVYKDMLENHGADAKRAVGVREDALDSVALNTFKNKLDGWIDKNEYDPLRDEEISEYVNGLFSKNMTIDGETGKLRPYSEADKSSDGKWELFRDDDYYGYQLKPNWDLEISSTPTETDTGGGPTPQEIVAVLKEKNKPDTPYWRDKARQLLLKREEAGNVDTKSDKKTKDENAPAKDAGETSGSKGTETPPKGKETPAATTESQTETGAGVTDEFSDKWKTDFPGVTTEDIKNLYEASGVSAVIDAAKEAYDNIQIDVTPDEIINKIKGSITLSDEEEAEMKSAMEEADKIKVRPDPTETVASVQEDFEISDEQAEELKKLLSGVPIKEPKIGKRYSMFTSAKLDSLAVDAAIHNYSADSNIDPDLTAAVISVESSWDKDAVSYIGAEGLMQVRPGTGRDMGVEDLFNPVDNIRAGTKYLRLSMDMMEKAGKEPLLDWALAGYNAGPWGVLDWETIPPDVQRYINKVKAKMESLKEGG